MTPEQKARQKIDRMLEQSGWIVQSPKGMNISAGLGVAIREFPLKTGFADYMLYADAKAIGVVEAKPEGHTLTDVETQSLKYTLGLPDELPHYRLSLPFAYESTGTVTQFSNWLEPDARSREVFSFHRPEELIRLTNLETQLRANLRQMPPLDAGRLWKVQIDAILKNETDVNGSLLRSARLRQAILKRAFEGKLVPQDPKDEPAQLLLSRTQTARVRDTDAGANTTGRGLSTKPVNRRVGR